MVEVAVWHPDADGLSLGVTACIEQAYVAIEHVHLVMSYQDNGSELSRFNRQALNIQMAYSPALIEVLAFCQRLSVLTDSVFDVCCEGANWRSIEVDVPSCSLRKIAALRVDLSGVAKGYAVDCAVMALQGAGVAGGWVNAGGDVRVFGSAEHPLKIRSPKDPSTLIDCGWLNNAAAATSASYLLDAPVLRHGLSRQLVVSPSSWTVRADHCMAADALTKVIAATGERNHPVLQFFNAKAWIND
jgi:FAD:protein FMN transferase